MSLENQGHSTSIVDVVLLSKPFLGFLLLWTFLLTTFQLSSNFGIYKWKDDLLAQHLIHALSLSGILWLTYFFVLVYLLKYLKAHSYRSNLIGLVNHQEKPQSKVLAKETRSSQEGLQDTFSQDPISPYFSLKYFKFYVCTILLLTRVSWWTAPPSPSEDVWRYLWDGERVVRSQNIYTTAPKDVKLLGFDDKLITLQKRIGHAHIPTVYPPGAQLFFGLSAQLSRFIIQSTKYGRTLQAPEQLVVHLTCWRFLLLLSDLAVLAVLLALLRHFSLRPEWSLLYALSPIVAFETALSAHLDLLGIFFLIFSLLLICQERYFYAGMMIGVGITIKLLPACLLFFTYLFLKNEYKLRRDLNKIWTLSFSTLLTIYLICLPFMKELLSLKGLWPGLQTYQQHWNFNGSLYPFLYSILNEIREYFEMISFTEQKLRLYLKVFIFIVFCLWITFQAKKLKSLSSNTQDKRALVLICFNGLCLIFICSPVIYGWYLLWLVPFSIIVLAITYCNKYIIYINYFTICISTIVWFFMVNLTYIPRHQLLCGEGWSFDDLCYMIEYGILALTLLLVKRYTLLLYSANNQEHSP